jgi:nucleoside-diphosphate-sugar epimerase
LLSRSSCTAVCITQAQHAFKNSEEDATGPLLVHREEDATDPKSRHKGKLETEALLADRGVNFTSLRPVYIYGPLNYNPVEEFFFHRLSRDRPVCVPGSGMQVTQLGHVKDLAAAFVKCLGNPKAAKQIYNVSGTRRPPIFCPPGLRDR